MNLIGLCGSAGVGKNTFAEEFHSHGYVEFSFAGALKKACIEIFGFTHAQMHDPIFKETDDPYWGVSPRWMLQFVGTDLFRDNFGEDFWIRVLERKLISLYSDPKDVRAVITDVRFQNEAQWILNNGGTLIHLTRPGFEGKVGIPGHASEAGIKFDSLTYQKENTFIHIENTGTISDLQSKANQFIRSNTNV